MTICTNCGVELEDAARHCPLCRAPVSFEPDREVPKAASYPEQTLDPEDFERFTAVERRKIFIEIYTVCTAIACVVVAAIELLLDRRFGWSLYPIASLAYLYLLICAPAMVGKHRGALYAVLAPATLLFVLALDLLDGSPAWFVPTGAPIVLLVEAVVIAATEFMARSRRRGVNAIAIALLGIAVLCAGIETVIDASLAGEVALSWSAVVAVTCLPIAGLLFYLHYRITREASLSKLFHL